jgi:hypothetical protein
VTAGAGGGAATSLGIGFQHRVGALVLAAMLIELDPLVPFQMTGDGQKVEQVRFETDDEIDDLVLIMTGGRIFIQAKRSVSLPESPGSEFLAVIRAAVSTRTGAHAWPMSSRMCSGSWSRRASLRMARLMTCQSMVTGRFCGLRASSGRSARSTGRRGRTRSRRA